MTGKLILMTPLADLYAVSIGEVTYLTVELAVEALLMGLSSRYTEEELARRVRKIKPLEVMGATPPGARVSDLLALLVSYTTIEDYRDPEDVTPPKPDIFYTTKGGGNTAINRLLVTDKETRITSIVAAERVPEILYPSWTRGAPIIMSVPTRSIWRSVRAARARENVPQNRAVAAAK